MTPSFLDALLGASVPVITEVKLTDGTGADLLGARTVGEVVDAYHDGAACGCSRRWRAAVPAAR